MWCKHDADDRERAERGGTRCKACGARFRDANEQPPHAGASPPGPFKAQTVKVKRR